MDIKGTVAVVSGGASGLGEAVGRLLVEKGGKVAIFDMAEEKGESLASEFGEAAIFYKTDVADSDNVQAAVNKTVATFGAVHAAISCAGVPYASKVLTKDGPIDMNLFDKVVRINLHGTMNVIRSAAEQMIKNKPNENGEKGVVINTASGAAFEGQIGQAAYSASKAGLIGMTLPIAREFAAYGIRIMTIAPGLFETPMVAGLPDKVRDALIAMLPFPRRMGQPSEFAMLCRQIIENPMLNGRTIRLDGAVTMHAK
jgi:NAD(P)-dependent dehydrogenase (short-subunit alcohol dehydrogenase family)